MTWYLFLRSRDTYMTGLRDSPSLYTPIANSSDSHTPHTSPSGIVNLNWLFALERYSQTGSTYPADELEEGGIVFNDIIQAAALEAKLNFGEESQGSEFNASALASRLNPPLPATYNCTFSAQHNLSVRHLSAAQARSPISTPPILHIPLIHRTHRYMMCVLHPDLLLMHYISYGTFYMPNTGFLLHTFPLSCNPYPLSTTPLSTYPHPYNSHSSISIWDSSIILSTVAQTKRKRRNDGTAKEGATKASPTPVSNAHARNAPVFLVKLPWCLPHATHPSIESIQLASQAWCHWHSTLQTSGTLCDLWMPMAKYWADGQRQFCCILWSNVHSCWLSSPKVFWR